MCTVPIVMGITAVSGLATAYGQVQQGKASSAMYNYQAKVAAQQIEQEKTITEQNVKLTERTAEQNRILMSIEAAEESKSLARKTAELKGTQRAAIGKMGIGGVTAEDITGATFDKAKLNQLALQYNADLKSWATNEDVKNRVWRLKAQSERDILALENEIQSYNYASKYSKRSGYISAGNTLLSTAVSMGRTYSLLS